MADPKAAYLSITRFDSRCMKCNKSLPKGSQYVFRKEPKLVACEECANKMAITIFKSKQFGTSGYPSVPEPQKKKPSSSPIQYNTEEMKEKIDKLVDDAIKDKKEQTQEESKKIVEETKDSLEEVKKNFKNELTKEFGAIPKQIIELKKPDGEVKKIKEIVNPVFKDVIMMVQANIPVFLTGAAGCGKNHLCKTVSEALDLDFYFSNAITNEFKVTGFVDANGKYHDTQFFNAFTKGGLFFFDEIDASIPEILVLLNAAIENKYFNFPHGKFEAHPDFRIIAAGNTYGTGADMIYVGRYQLDGASLDRFALVKMDYDETIENLMSGGNTEIVDAVRFIREVARKNDIKIIMSYRAINQLARLVDVQGMSIRRAVECVLIKGINIDDLKVISNSITHTENKFLTMFKEIVSDVQE